MYKEAAVSHFGALNEEKTKYMLVSRHQNAGQNHNTNI
jgi:hypothetical protein